MAIDVFDPTRPWMLDYTQKPGTYDMQPQPMYPMQPFSAPQAPQGDFASDASGLPLSTMPDNGDPFGEKQSLADYISALNAAGNVQQPLMQAPRQVHPGTALLAGGLAALLASQQRGNQDYANPALSMFFNTANQRAQQEAQVANQNAQIGYQNRMRQAQTGVQSAGIQYENASGKVAEAAKAKMQMDLAKQVYQRTIDKALIDQDTKVKIAQMSNEEKRYFASIKDPEVRFQKAKQMGYDDQTAREIAYSPDILNLAKSDQARANAEKTRALVGPMVDTEIAKAKNLNASAAWREAVKDEVVEKTKLMPQESQAKIAQGWARIRVMEQNANTNAAKGGKGGPSAAQNQIALRAAYNMQYKALGEAGKLAKAKHDAGAMTDQEYLDTLETIQSQRETIGTDMENLGSQFTGANPEAAKQTVEKVKSSIGLGNRPPAMKGNIPKGLKSQTAGDVFSELYG